MVYILLSSGREMVGEREEREEIHAHQRREIEEKERETRMKRNGRLSVDSQIKV